MSVIKTGKPTIESAGSALLGQKIAETTPNEISLTNLLSNALSEFDDGALIVLDPMEGRIMATSVAARIAEVNALLAAGSKLDFSPDAGQSGRSLAFSAAAGNTLAGIDGADLTTAVKPKFTVESIVARLLSKIQEREASAPAEANQFYVVVDQVNKKVGIRKVASLDAHEDLSAIVWDGGESVKIKLTPDAEEQVSNPLPFEGGAV